MNMEYSLAISEVLSILNDFDKTDVEKIPQSFMDFLKSNADTTYMPKFDKTKAIKDLNLKKETKGLLSLIYKSYFCENEEDKTNFNNILKENIKKQEKELSEKYDVNKILISRQKPLPSQEQFDKSMPNLVKYKKETIFTKIINKIKNFFGRRK